MTKLKLLTAFFLLLATSNTCHGGDFESPPSKSNNDSSSSSSEDTGAVLSVELNLDFVGYEDATDCNPDDQNQFISGTTLSVSVSKDGKQNNPEDGVYGDFCEETLYDIEGNQWTAYTKIEITCQVAAIGRFYYDCGTTNQDCSDCEEEAFQYSVEEWEDWLTPSDGMCYSSTSTVAAVEVEADDDADADADNDADSTRTRLLRRDSNRNRYLGLTVANPALANDDEDEDDTRVVTASWKFVGEYTSPEIDQFLNFYLDNSCIGDGIPEPVVDPTDNSASSDDTCVTIEDVVCGEEYPAEELTTFCTYYQSTFEFSDPESDVDVPITLFVPNDEAFAMFETLIDASSTDTLDQTAITDILLFHAMQEPVLYQDLECSALSTMDNQELSRTKCLKNEDTDVVEKYQKGGGNRKNDLLPKIIIADILTCNGSVIHVINEVMLPNSIAIIEQ